MEALVEVDEALINGNETGRHWGEKLNAGHGTVAKAAVLCVKECKTKHIRAEVAVDTFKPNMQDYTNETRSKREFDISLLPCLIF